MPDSHPIRRFSIAFLATALLVAVILQTDWVERISYKVEKGRLHAVAESLNDADSVEIADHSTRAVAEIVMPAVVQVIATRVLTRDAVTHDTQDSDSFREAHPWMDDTLDADGVFAGTEIRDLGSGFIVDAERGMIITNDHVTAGADHIDVRLSDGRICEAALVGSDPASDLALLSVNVDRLHAISFGNSSELAVGDEVFAIGHPFGLETTFSRGIVSALGRSGIAVGGPGVTYTGFIQTDTLINPGNSGGPLVNHRGQVIGVNTAIATDTGHFDGVGFAIPASRVVALIPHLMRGTPIERGYLGVGTIDLRNARETIADLGWDDDQGVLIRFVQSGGPAKAAGLESGDILIAVNGTPIESTVGLMDLIAEFQPNSVITADYFRNGRVNTVKITLVRRPDGV